MDLTAETLKVNGVDYVRADSLPSNAPSIDLDGKPFVVIRSRDSGCHAGYVESEDGRTITLVKSRRLWYWTGAASLSQLAMEGVKSPDSCKFPMAVDRITVYDICEKIETNAASQESILGVPEWNQ